MAPVRFAGFCVRPSKPPNPNFSESLGFPLFLLQKGSQRISEGKGHVCMCSLELLGTTGKPRSRSPDVFGVMLRNDIASLAGMHRHRAESRAHRVGLSVCLLSRAQLPCLLVSEHKGKGTASGHQPPLVKHDLN